MSCLILPNYLPIVYIDYRAYQLGPSSVRVGYNDGVRVGIGSELVWRSVRVGSFRVGLVSELV